MNRTLIALLLLVPLLTGCLDLEDQWVLNPDGSGKLIRQATFAPMDKSPETWAKEALGKATGFEAWSNFESEKLADGRLRITATGYFKDVNAVNGGLGPVPRMAEAGEQRIVTFEEDEKTFRGMPGKRGGEGEEGEFDEAVAKAMLKMVRGMLAMLEDAKIESSLQLPGRVSKKNNLREKEGKLLLRVEFKKVLAALDQRLKDPAALRASKGRLDFGSMSEAIFGAAGSPSATVEVGAPSFDYAAEVEVAKADWAQLEKRIQAAKESRGLTGSVDEGPKLETSGAPRLRQAEVGALHYLHSGRGLPMRDTSVVIQGSGFVPQARLHVIASLSRQVLEVKNLSVSEALSAEGKDLRWAEAKHEGELLSDQPGALRLNFGLAMPAKGYGGLASFKASLEVVTASKTVEEALGFTSLAKDAAGAKHSAKVKSISEMGSGQHMQLELVGIPAAEIAGLKLRKKDGTEVELRLIGKNVWGDEQRASLFVSLQEAAEGDLILVRNAGLETTKLELALGPCDAYGRTQK